MTGPGEVESQEEPQKSQSTFFKGATRAVLGLYANGWYVAFSVAFLMLGGLVFQEGGSGLVVGAGAACLVATYFSLAVGPFLDRWRAALLERSYWPRSVALTTGLLFWTAVSWSLLLLGIPYAFGVGGGGASALETVLLSLDRILDGLGLTIVGLSWMVGMGACLLGRHALAEDPLVYGGSTTWRKLLGAVLLVPYLLVCGGAAATAWQGRRLDPGIIAAYELEIAASLARKNDDLQAITSGVPEAFLQAAPVRQWLHPEVGVKLDRKALLNTWCEEAARLWTGQRFWSTPSLVALARLARDRHIAGLDPEKSVPAELLAELAIRSEVVLLEWGGVDVSTTQRLYDMRLSAQTWAKLVELGLSRTDLATSATLDDTDVRDRFVQGAARVLSKSDYDMDGKLQRRFFQRSLERKELNALWRAFELGKPYPPPAAPLGVEAFRKRYSASLDFDLAGVDADIQQATYQEDVDRQTLAYDIVMMELKRLEAEGEPLPRTFEQLRPPVAAIARAYAEWMILKPGPDGVTLKRVDPHRNGMTLSHRFWGREQQP